jgi:hypothetical protein
MHTAQTVAAQDGHPDHSIMDKHSLRILVNDISSRLGISPTGDIAHAGLAECVDCCLQEDCMLADAAGGRSWLPSSKATL